jgi:hypothetical protein
LLLKINKKITGNRTLDEWHTVCVPLLLAAMKGDWAATKAFLKKHPDYVNLPITIEKATVLHCAAAVKRTYFVEKVLEWMTPGDLELTTTDGDTAINVAEEMVEKNNELPLIRNYLNILLHYS